MPQWVSTRIRPRLISQSERPGWRVSRVVLFNQGALSGIGGIRPIGDPLDPRRRLGEVPLPAAIPGLPAASSYVIGASTALGNPYNAPSYARGSYFTPDVLLGRGDPEAAALPMAWQSGPSVPSGQWVVPQASLQPGLSEEAVVRADAILTPPAASRSAPANQPGMLVQQAGRGPELIDPGLQVPRPLGSLLARQAAYVTAQPGIRSIARPIEGQWTYGPDNTYIPGEKRAFERNAGGLAPLLAGEVDQVTLVDPRISRPAAPSQWSYPQSALGPAPAGVITADQLLGYRGQGPNTVLNRDLTTPYAEYLRGLATDDRWQDGVKVYDPASARESIEFTSMDPTLEGVRRGSSERAPFGVVRMPAIDARGNWTDRSGRPLVTVVDPTQVVEVRTANPDATYSGDRVEEVNLGKIVNEALEENKTPVLTRSRLKQLLNSKDGPFAGGRRVRQLDAQEGSAVAEVALRDIEDRAILRRPTGRVVDRLLPTGQVVAEPEFETFVAPSADYRPVAGEVLVGVKRAVPVDRIETVYRPERNGEQLATSREVADGLTDTRLEIDDLFRIGNPQARDWNAIREQVQPYVAESGVARLATRVSEWDLNTAEQRGQIERFMGLPVTKPDGRVEVVPVDPGTPDAQPYIRRAASGATSLVTPRLNQLGQSIAGQFLIDTPGARAVPVGPAPFLVAPAGSTQDQINAVGGIRRNAEKGKLGQPFSDTLYDIAAGAYMLPPTQRSGMEDILGALGKVRNQALAAGATEEQAKQAVAQAARDISRLSVSGQQKGEPNRGPIAKTSLDRISQAMREQGGSRVDLFSEAEISPRDKEFADLYRDEVNKALAARELAGEVVSGLEVVPGGDNAGIADLVSRQLSPEAPDDEANQQGAYGDFGDSERRGYRVIQAGDTEAVSDAFRDSVVRAFPGMRQDGVEYLAEVARRSAAATGGDRPQWNAELGRFEASAEPGVRFTYPDAVVQQVVNRPVTVVQPARVAGDARQIALNLGRGYRPVSTPGADAGPRAMDEQRAGAWSMDQLRLPLDAAPAAPAVVDSMPETVQAGLAREPGHPARIAAEQFLAARRRRMG